MLELWELLSPSLVSSCECLGSSQVAASCTYLGSITIQVACSSLSCLQPHKFLLASSPFPFSYLNSSFYSVMLFCSSILPIVRLVLVFPFFNSALSSPFHSVIVFNSLCSFSVYICVVLVNRFVEWHSYLWVWFITWKTLSSIDVSLSFST